ncbi:MAG: carotenoid oxygenase family protein [Novosphingobium sp.]
MALALETTIRSIVRGGISTLAEFNRKRLPLPDKPHPYLRGIHAPMDSELTYTDLEVTGAIPPQLNGRYLRIGPNPIAADPKSYHWFLGDGMVHGVSLQAGRAGWYRNRWIRSRSVGKALDVPAAAGPRHSVFDTVNTNVIGHDGSAWALVEAGSTPVKLGEMLDEQSYDDFGGTLDGGFTGHPHRDPASGELHAICYDATVPNEVRHVVVAPDGFSMGALVGGRGYPFRWNRSHQARIGLLPREGSASDVIWIDVDPCYIFHTVNAFNLPDGRVVLDAVVYDRMFHATNQGPDANPRGLERWMIDPEARTAERHLIDPSPQEFPRIDERRTGRAYRFAYSMDLPKVFSDQLVGATSIFRHDLEAGTRQRHEFGPNRFPGEFVFVPRHANAAEDEGWLLGYVVDMGNNLSDLAIIDAQAFEAEPVATVRIPHCVPAGFHGNWVASPSYG